LEVFPILHLITIRPPILRSAEGLKPILPLRCEFLFSPSVVLLNKLNELMLAGVFPEDLPFIVATRKEFWTIVEA
jgi:hypothetical protein